MPTGGVEPVHYWPLLRLRHSLHPLQTPHKMLCRPDLVLSKPGSQITTYLVGWYMWARLRDRLSSVDSSSSMVQITEQYAARFYDVYIDKRTRKLLTGDRHFPFFFGTYRTRGDWHVT